MSDKILVECGCGKRYRVPLEKVGATLECKHCGETFVAEQSVDASEDRPVVGAPADTDSAVDPGRLMSHITGLRFSGTLIVSLVIHAVLVGVTSIAFVQLCVSLGTTDPRAEIQRRELEQKEKDKEQARKDYKAKLLAEQAKRATEKPAEAKTGPKTDDASAAPARAKSPVEKRVEEKSKERPKASNMSLDDDLDLD